MRNEQVQTASYRHLGTMPNGIHERLYYFPYPEKIPTPFLIVWILAYSLSFYFF